MYHWLHAVCPQRHTLILTQGCMLQYPCYITMLCILMRWIYRQQLQLLLGKPNYIYSFASALHPLRPPPQTWFSSCDKPRTGLARFFTTIHWRTCSYPLTAAVELLINCRQDFSNLKKNLQHCITRPHTNCKSGWCELWMACSCWHLFAVLIFWLP